MIPYSCDATLPRAERYASEKYRRFSRRFRPKILLWSEILELYGWMKFLNSPANLQLLMLWEERTIKFVRYVMKDPDVVRAGQPYVDANFASATMEDGFAVLRALQDNGWKSGNIPKIVKMALAEEWHTTGISTAKQAEKHGLTLDQCRFMRSPRRKRADPSRIALVIG